MDMGSMFNRIREKSAEVSPGDFTDDEAAVPTDAKNISRILSPEERLADQGKKKTTTASRTTLLYRNIRRNPDIVFWILALLAALVVGFFVAKVYFGMTTEEITLGFMDLVFFLVSAISTIGFSILKLYSKAGPLVEALQKKGNKENIDEYGRTVVGK